MDPQAEDQVTARMVGPPDVEAVRIGVLGWIAHCGNR